MSNLWSYAKKNDLIGLKELFDKGIGIKAKDDDGKTLLHHAAENNAMDIVVFLIDKGADIDARDNSGYTVSLIYEFFNTTLKLVLHSPCYALQCISLLWKRSFCFLSSVVPMPLQKARMG